MGAYITAKGGRTLLRGGALALSGGEAHADLLIEGETIAAIGENLSADGAETVDVSGCHVLPGAIDTHTHFDLPVSGTVTADDFDSGTRAAILGGTTAVLDFATQNRGGTLRAAYEVWRGRMDGKAHCDVGFHMAITDWNDRTAAEIADMDALGVTSYKFYMAYPALMVEDDAIYAALKHIRAFGGLCGFHCENGRLVNALVAEQKAKGNLSPAAHPLSRPPEVEAEAVARLLRIARLADAPVNIVHLSSKLGLETIRWARAPGQRVFIETCPQYLLLDDGLLSRDDGAKFVCSPPLRKKQDAEALWQAVASGEIATVGTDHCAFNYAGQKLTGRNDFSTIPNGLPGVGHRVALMLSEGVAKGLLTLAQAVRVLCENPARLFGLYPRKGVLAAGSDADIVVWDPARAGVIRAETQAQRVDYTPYEGFVTTGGVRDVWLRGTRAVRDARLETPQNGRFLQRNRSFACAR